MIEKGKGIEINTGGLKRGMRDIHPCTGIIKRYKSLGGEIITVGSDAHVSQNIAAYFNRAEDVLKECGFQYYTIFERRMPYFQDFALLETLIITILRKQRLIYS